MAMVRMSLPTRLAYGFGSVAYGVNNNGLDYFLLIFYSQVLGVDAPLVGLALLLALVFDSLSDPLVGYLSDNTHSRWGRRHPWMYAAALPVAAAYFMLWAPPAELSGNELFPYLFGLAIVVRTLITLYEVPASALIAELTDEYDERTSLVSLRYFFGWAGGTIMATVALAVFLVPTETLSSGLMNRQGYATYGMAASLVILVSILVASLGTHSHIPHLRAPPPKTRFELGRIYRELYETLSSRSFLALFVSTILGAVAAGLAAGLNFYVSGYFWEFSTDQIAVLSVSIIASAFLALFLAPIVSRRLGKKRGAIIVGVIAFSTAPAPVALRLLGVMPENGDPVLFPIILVTAVLDVALIITTQILGTSMVADLVEESEIRTSRRSEGVFFAAMTFTRKAVQGFGVLAATAVLALVSFPKGVAPGLVPEETLFRLGAWYASSLFVIWMLMIACLRFYRIDRGQHEDNLRTLASRG